jgi:hypothetical protein
MGRTPVSSQNKLAPQAWRLWQRLDYGFAGILEDNGHVHVVSTVCGMDVRELIHMKSAWSRLFDNKISGLLGRASCQT